jgi:hypothetical protein
MSTQKTDSSFVAPSAGSESKIKQADRIHFIFSTPETEVLLGSLVQKTAHARETHRPATKETQAVLPRDDVPELRRAAIREPVDRPAEVVALARR